VVLNLTDFITKVFLLYYESKMNIDIKLSRTSLNKIYM